MRDYAAALEIDLAYQDFEAELAGLPGLYAPPAGELLIARNDSGTPCGCVGLKPLPGISPTTAEMKRLFAAPGARGTGLGRALAEAIIAAAQRLGYREMLLDTLSSMAPARALYAALGFHEIPPYYDTPVAGTVFLRRML